MVIWKYPLEIADVQTVEMPAKAHILHVGAQGGQVWLWAMVDPDRKLQPRTIRIVGTGSTVPDEVASGAWHLGTVQQGPSVWHVFEEGL